jgi:hypothetical protein
MQRCFERPRARVGYDGDGGNTMNDAEQKRSLVDEMIRSRIANSGETKAEAIQSILASVAAGRNLTK